MQNQYYGTYFSEQSNCGFKHVLKYMQRLSYSENMQIIPILKTFLLSIGDIKINVNISFQPVQVKLQVLRYVALQKIAQLGIGVSHEMFSLLAELMLVLPNLIFEIYIGIIRKLLLNKALKFQKCRGYPWFCGYHLTIFLQKVKCMSDAFRFTRVVGEKYIFNTCP